MSKKIKNFCRPIRLQHFLQKCAPLYANKGTFFSFFIFWVISEIFSLSETRSSRRLIKYSCTKNTLHKNVTTKMSANRPKKRRRQMQNLHGITVQKSLEFFQRYTFSGKFFTGFHRKKYQRYTFSEIFLWEFSRHTLKIAKISSVIFCLFPSKNFLYWGAGKKNVV